MRDRRRQGPQPGKQVEVKYQRRTERRALARADQTRVDQWIAQQALQRRAGHTHGRAHDQRQQSSRQSDLTDDEPFPRQCPPCQRMRKPVDKGGADIYIEGADAE